MVRQDGWREYAHFRSLGHSDKAATAAALYLVENRLRITYGQPVRPLPSSVADLLRVGEESNSSLNEWTSRVVEAAPDVEVAVPTSQEPQQEDMPDEWLSVAGMVYRNPDYYAEGRAAREQQAGREMAEADYAVANTREVPEYAAPVGNARPNREWGQPSNFPEMDPREARTESLRLEAEALNARLAQLTEDDIESEITSESGMSVDLD